MFFTFRCQAYGGRPVPKFVWFINNNNNDNLYGQDGFQVRNKCNGKIGDAEQDLCSPFVLG